MAVLEAKPGQATEKAGGTGTITIIKLLGDGELDGKCDMYAKVIIPPLCSIGANTRAIPRPITSCPAVPSTTTMERRSSSVRARQPSAQTANSTASRIHRLRKTSSSWH